MRIASAGHAAFAATLIAVGLLGLVRGDFAPVWEPVPKDVPARQALAYLCALVSMASGIGLLWRRTAAPAARLLLVSLLFWLLLFRAPVVFRAPGAAVSWESLAETTVIVAGAWALYGSLANDWDKRHLGFATGTTGVRIATTLYGLALIPFGFAHFAYVDETAALVPPWLPSHVTWVYVTGATYLAAGVAVLVGVYARLAAALSASQMGLFTVLVWLPVVATAHASAFQWSEAIISWALTTAGWVVADAYRGVPWLAMRKR